MANNAKGSFSPRAFTSVLAGLSFVLMVVTGLVLFFAPACRIARDTSWAVLGQSKDQWVAVHVWLSIVFVVASLIHVYLNWTALINYFKDKVRKGWAFRAEWVAALAVCVLLYAGSAREVAPFSSLMAWKETFKHPSSGGDFGRGYRGGRGTAQSGVGGAWQDLSGAELHSTEPGSDLHQSRMSGYGPGQAGIGIGRKTLSQFCSDEGVDLSRAISTLQSRGLTARETMTMREIADSLGIHPREMRSILQLE